MKILFLILISLITFTVQGQVNTDSVDVDTYTTHRDSPDSTVTEMSWEEMEELWAELEKKRRRRNAIKSQLQLDLEEALGLPIASFPANVQQNLLQDKQNYTDYYGRRSKNYRKN